MKAVVYDRYGPPDVLHIEDVPKPDPKADELLVRVRASAVNRLDVHIREAQASYGSPVLGFVSRLVSGYPTPRHRIAGSEYSGVVEAVGPAVHSFRAGDEVFGLTGLRGGASAEYLVARHSSWVAIKPANTTFDEAAGIADGFRNAWLCLNQVHLEPGDRVLVYGASGSIGTAGVQLARHFGADVTAVCTRNTFDLVRSLGAGAVMDYTQEDFTKNGQKYRVVFDAVGKHSFARSKASLEPGGWYLATDGARNMFLAPWTRVFGDKKVTSAFGPSNPQRDLEFLRQLVEAGEYRPVIDRTYPMSQVVEAASYVESQQKVGNVVLQIA